MKVSPLHAKRLSPLFGLFLLTILLILTASAGYALPRALNVGIYENQPKVFTEADGTPAGIFVDIIEEIARQEDWTLNYVPGSWAQCLARLESGAIDLMMDVAYSPERALKYDFCENDVISNWAQVYTRDGLNIDLITDLEGKRVATLNQGIHLIRLNHLANAFGFQFKLTAVDDYETVFRMLHEKKVDAGVVNRIYGYANEDQFRVNRTPVVFSPASLRFAVKKGDNADITEAIDGHLASMKAKKGSVYHQSIRQWLGETSKLNLPHWIGWALGIATTGILLLFAMSMLLQFQVNRKTAHLQMANAQLEKQVTETMKAHLELKHSEERLIRQERLSAIGQMASGIAHDFNNMLIPILGYSDLLLEKPDMLSNPERVLPMLEAMREAARTSRETVKRLQEFHRADPRLKMDTVNVADLVAEVVAATKPLWKSSREAQSIPVRIIEEIPKDLVVTASKSQLREALMNLLLNALHAITDKGEVIIRASAQNDSLNLEVSDTGAGMSAEIARQCLEPFFSTKGEEGTGMGLAMVHGIVKRHDGTLRINSAPEKGTSIAIQLPLKQTFEGRQTTMPTFSLPNRSLKVLAVDDDENARALLYEYLTLDGHHVTTAADTAQGIAEFDKDFFDLVITDRAMPKMSGDELAKHLKKAKRGVPVIMVTGFSHIMASQGEQPAGVDFILGKPFTLQELRDAVEQAFPS